MKRTLLVIAVVVVYVLHQDFWFWKTPYFFGVIPFGFVPIGLFYQGCYSILAALLMWLLVKFAWPAHLEREVEQQKPKGDSAA